LGYFHNPPEGGLHSRLLPLRGALCHRPLHLPELFRALGQRDGSTDRHPEGAEVPDFLQSEEARLRRLEKQHVQISFLLLLSFRHRAGDELRVSGATSASVQAFDTYSHP